jgi:hypothetical protein
VTDTVTLETYPNGHDAYMVGGKTYYAQEGDTVEGFIETARHYTLIAKYLDSPEQREHQRLKARRVEIARRYGINANSPYQMQDTTKAMIEDILKLEEAANPAPIPKLVKRPATASDGLLGLDEVGGH